MKAHCLCRHQLGSEQRPSRWRNVVPSTREALDRTPATCRGGRDSASMVNAPLSCQKGHGLKTEIQISMSTFPNVSEYFRLKKSIVLPPTPSRVAVIKSGREAPVVWTGSHRSPVLLAGPTAGSHCGRQTGWSLWALSEPAIPRLRRLRRKRRTGPHKACT